MAASANGRYLYPIVEGAYADDADLRRRWIHEFDTRAASTPVAPGPTRPTRSQRRRRRVHGDSNDMLLLDRARRLRGPAVGDEARLRGRPPPHRRPGYLEKTLVARRCCASPTPTASARRARAYGVERSVLASRAVRRDGGAARRTATCSSPTTTTTRATTRANPGTPDDTEMVVIDLDARRRRTRTRPRSIGHRGAAATGPSTRSRRTSRRSWQCADYIEPDVVLDQGRRARRPARERDQRHHGRRQPARVRRAAGRPR